MKDGPSIAPIAALAGDPARANMLSALIGGKALTAGELAREAGVTAQTASSHLAKLAEGGLIAGVKQGRHRYFRLAGSDVAEMLEKMMGVAERAGHMRMRTGPNAPELRKARVCYDHLAGEMGVALFDNLVGARFVARRGRTRGSQNAAKSSRAVSVSISTHWQGSAARCANPASTGACAAIISRARWARRCWRASTRSNGPAAIVRAVSSISRHKASAAFSGCFYCRANSESATVRANSSIKFSGVNMRSRLFSGFYFPTVVRLAACLFGLTSSAGAATYATFTVPGAKSTTAIGINDAGTVVGGVTDTQDDGHGFVRAADGTITIFDPPGAISSWPVGIDKNGTVAGNYYESGFLYHGFARAADGAITILDIPKSRGIFVAEIGGDIFGSAAYRKKRSWVPTLQTRTI